MNCYYDYTEFFFCIQSSNTEGTQETSGLSAT